MNQGVTAPRLRRAYFECRYGQLHVHNAIPAGGGFDEQTTLVCLHAHGTTGRSFLELSRVLGQSRSVYSPDIPGCGESDAPPKALPMAGYAEAIADFTDSMRFRQMDLIGVHNAAGIAIELALARPKIVRRVVMIGAPILDADERKSYKDLSAPEGLTLGATWVRATLADWRGESRVALVKQPLLLLRPKDSWWDAGGRLAKLLPGAKVVDLPEQEKRVLETQSALVAKHVTHFLSAG